MKEIILVVAILLLVPSFAFGSVTCSPCNTDSCSCSISDCSSGKLLVFSTNDCSGVPTDKPAFSSGSATWYPSSAGTVYVKPYCDNTSIVTNCYSLSVASTSSTSTTTRTIGGFPSGCKKAGYTCTAVSLCCAGLQCIDDICRAQITVTTSTSSTTTSTNILKQDCPFDCCQGEDRFNDKSCDPGFQCVANTCQAVTQTPLPSPSGSGSLFPWSIIIPAILVIIFLPLFLFFFILKRKQGEWKKLYEKWRKPSTRR